MGFSRDINVGEAMAFMTMLPHLEPWGLRGMDRKTEATGYVWANKIPKKWGGALGRRVGGN